jgi:hypothetical protein
MAFHIEAATQTLFKSKGDFLPIFDTKKYFIPIYQRPYTWAEKDVKRLLDGIVETFQKDSNDPYFMGTIQLKPESEGFAIIDGQQRLTTMLLIFKSLDLLSQVDCNIYDNRLSSKVSTQTENLTTVFALTEVKEEHAKSQNIHIKRLYEIHNHLKELPEGVELPALVTYLKENLYFVVINTDAGLSKTIDIFNTINTTGQDLSTGDIFKVQLFEYLKKYQGAKDDVFTEIDGLYKIIDKGNKTYEWNHGSMEGVLDIYRTILVTRHGLSRALLSPNMTSDIFWESFFAVMLKNEKITGFTNHKETFENAITIADLKKVINEHYLWINKNIYTDKFQVFSHLLWWHGRYAIHHIVLNVYLFKYYKSDETFDKERFEAFALLLFKYLFIQGLRYKRQVNETHRFVYNLTYELYHEDIDVVFKTLKTNISNLEDSLTDILKSNIFEVAQRRNFLSWLTAILCEAEESGYGFNIQKYFNYEDGIDYDIEHIQALEAESTTEAWQNDTNTFGNLILLERGINRSISNDEIGKKLDANDGNQSYHNTNLPIVKQFIKDFDGDWTIEKVETRRTDLIKIVTNFLFK